MTLSFFGEDLYGQICFLGNRVLSAGGIFDSFACCHIFPSDRKRSFSRIAMVMIGLAMRMISGVDIVLLQKRFAMASQSSDLMDDALFSSKPSLALYLLPLVLTGLGINVISHMLPSHGVIAGLEQVRPGGSPNRGKGNSDT
jgi:hypothetical protein